MDSTELSSILKGDQVESRLRERWGDIVATVGELGDLAMEDGRGRHKDNVEHTILVTAKTPNRIRVRLTGLFHDVGKPPTRRIEEDGTVSFHGHEALGEKMTVKILKRLGYEAELATQVGRLVGLSGATKGSEAWSDSAVRRFTGSAGELLEDLLCFALVDVTSKHQVNHDRVANEISALRSRIDEVRAKDEAARWRPVVSGDDIMGRYSLTAGPKVGAMLRLVREAELSAKSLGKGFSVETAWEMLDDWVSQQA